MAAEFRGGTYGRDAHEHLSSFERASGSFYVLSRRTGFAEATDNAQPEHVYRMYGDFYCRNVCVNWTMWRYPGDIDVYVTLSFVTLCDL
jgi:hypothetical protein